MIKINIPNLEEMDFKYLRMAIGRAEEAKRFGEDPSGAILLYNGALTPAMDSCSLEGDPTAHAGITAIRDACSRHGSITLPGGTLYCSTEPCPMCLGAMHWAKLDRIIFSVSQSTLQEHYGEAGQALSDFVDAGNRKVQVMGPFLEEEGLRVFRDHTIKQGGEWRKDQIRPHGVDIVFPGGQLVLRPMAESDWPWITAWNGDPEVLYYSDGCDVDSYKEEELRDIYRGVSRRAYCFIMEWEGKPIGECWLQDMNLQGILSKHPGEDLRRVDLMIGEKGMWGKGIGSSVITGLTEWAYANTGVDRIYGCVLDYNPRSANAFKKAGYVLESIEPVTDSKKAIAQLNLVSRRGSWEPRKSGI